MSTPSPADLRNAVKVLHELKRRPSISLVNLGIETGLTTREIVAAKALLFARGMIDGHDRPLAAAIENIEGAD